MQHAILMRTPTRDYASILFMTHNARAGNRWWAPCNLIPLQDISDCSTRVRAFALYDYLRIGSLVAYVAVTRRELSRLS